MSEIKIKLWDHSNKRILSFWAALELFRLNIRDEKIDTYYSDDTLMIYTGLVDANLNDIYTGHILMHPVSKEVFEVVLKDGSFLAKYGSGDYGNLSLQVGDKGGACIVGSIFEDNNLQ